MRSMAEIEREIRARANDEGYSLNPDAEIAGGIIEGIAVNEDRIGYWRCPCRQSQGYRNEDQDIICPCAYRDADLEQYGRCYCALYVTRGYLDRGSPPDPVPERRPAATGDRGSAFAKASADTPGAGDRERGEGEAAKGKSETANGIRVQGATAEPGTGKRETGSGTTAALPVWRCTVCGYLCARSEAPPVCPICRAKQEQFEEFPVKMEAKKTDEKKQKAKRRTL